MTFGEDLDALQVQRVREWISTHPAGIMGYGITGDSLRIAHLAGTARRGREILLQLQAEGFVAKSRTRWFIADQAARDAAYGRRTDAYRGRL
jgi:hypothetical protein